MSHRKSNRSHKKNKAKNQRDTKSRQDIYEAEEEYVKKVGQDIYGENIMQGGLGINTGDVNSNTNSKGISPEGEKKSNSDQVDTESAQNTDGNNINAENVNNSNNTDLNDICEEIKAKQQELLDRLKKVSDALLSLTLIRDSYNSIQVDNLTELYFTRQVRPLLDAMNIISFASTNMSATATAFQTSAFTDTKEIKNALKLSYRMNDEIDDIIHSLDRRLAIFLELIDNMDKNCPPFDSS